MRMTHRLKTAVLFAALGWMSSPSQAQTAAELQAQFQRDYAACETQQATTELEDCRREARNAYAEAKRGLLANAPNTPYHDNASQRCQVHKDWQDRLACEDRMRGGGRTEGSVEGGGVLREIVRPVVGQ